MIIEKFQKKFGSRWNTWTQDQWDEVLKVVEADDLKFPLLINRVMEAYTNGRKHVLTESVLAFVDDALRQERTSTITEEKFDKWMAFYMGKAKEILREQNKASAILFFHTTDSNVVVFPCSEFMVGIETKNALANIARFTAKEIEAKAVFFVSEMWVATYEPGPGEERPAPSDLPERREALMVNGQAIINGKIKDAMHMQFFHRKGAGDPDEEIVYGEFKEMPSTRETRFRFL